LALALKNAMPESVWFANMHGAPPKLIDMLNTLPVALGATVPVKLHPPELAPEKVPVDKTVTVAFSPPAEEATWPVNVPASAANEGVAS
jgi:hypothetical protein